MKEPIDTERLLRLLAEEKRPELSHYFEARLRRKLADEPAADARLARRMRQAVVVFLLFASILLWQYPYLRWVIPLMVILCLPEDWASAIARRFAGHRRTTL